MIKLSNIITIERFTALYMSVMALSLFWRPHAGSVFVLTGHSHWSIVLGIMFCAGALLALWASTMRDRALITGQFIQRIAIFIIATLPIFAYSGSTAYLFVVVRKLGSPTTPLTSPITSAAMGFLLIGYVIHELNCAWETLEAGTDE